jgi:hypothetical protein
MNDTQTFEIPPDFPITYCPDSRKVLDGLRKDPKTRLWTRRPIETRCQEQDKKGTCLLLDPRWESSVP